MYRSGCGKGKEAEHRAAVTRVGEVVYAAKREVAS